MMAKMPKISMFMLLSPFMPIHRSSSCVPRVKKPMKSRAPRAMKYHMPAASSPIKSRPLMICP